MFDDALADSRWKEIDNRVVDLCRGGKRPAFFSVARDNIDNSVGQLLTEAAFRLSFQLRSFGNGRLPVMSAGTVPHGEPPRLVCHFVEQSAVGVGQVKRLDKLETGATGWSFFDTISFQTAAICDDHQRGSCHLI